MNLSAKKIKQILFGLLLLLRLLGSRLAKPSSHRKGVVPRRERLLIRFRGCRRREGIETRRLWLWLTEVIEGGGLVLVAEGLVSLLFRRFLLLRRGCWLSKEVVLLCFRLLASRRRTPHREKVVGRSRLRHRLCADLLREKLILRNLGGLYLRLSHRLRLGEHIRGRLGLGSWLGKHVCGGRLGLGRRLSEHVGRGLGLSRRLRLGGLSSEITQGVVGVLSGSFFLGRGGLNLFEGLSEKILELLNVVGVLLAAAAATHIKSARRALVYGAGCVSRLGHHVVVGVLVGSLRGGHSAHCEGICSRHRLSLELLLGLHARHHTRLLLAHHLANVRLEVLAHGLAHGVLLGRSRLGVG